MDNENNAPESLTPAHPARMRVWSMRTIAAAAITAVALAGTGGAVLAATTAGSGSSGGPGRFMGPGQMQGQTGQMPGPGQGWRQAPGGSNGTMPGRSPHLSRVPQLPFSTDPKAGSDT